VTWFDYCGALSGSDGELLIVNNAWLEAMWFFHALAFLGDSRTVVLRDAHKLDENDIRNATPGSHTKEVFA
jgi:hypothetical protein